MLNMTEFKSRSHSIIQDVKQTTPNISANMPCFTNSKAPHHRKHKEVHIPHLSLCGRLCLIDRTHACKCNASTVEIPLRHMPPFPSLAQQNEVKASNGRGRASEEQRQWCK